MRVYLAARFSRRAELAGYAEILRSSGIEVTSRWLGGNHQIPKDGEVDGFEARRFAREDIEDLLAADTVVCFTEPDGTPHTRGGRHVEFGLALGVGKQVILIGPRENVFYWLPAVWRYKDFWNWFEEVWRAGRVTEKGVKDTQGEESREILTADGTDGRGLGNVEEVEARR